MLCLMYLSCHICAQMQYIDPLLFSSLLLLGVPLTVSCTPMHTYICIYICVCVNLI